jgi:hypothetical protein
LKGMTILPAPKTGTFTAKHTKIARMRISALKPLRKFGDVDNHLASS